MKSVSLDRAIEILKRHNRDFNGLMADDSHAFFLHSMDGTVLAVNDTACKMLRYSREQLLQMTIDKWEKNFDLSQIVTYWPRLPINKQLKFFGIHVKSDTGQFPVAMDAWVLDHQGDRILYSLVRDMTITEQVIGSLERSERRFHTIFNNAQEAIFIHGLDGSLLDTNQKASEMLGYTQQELSQEYSSAWFAPGGAMDPEFADALKAGRLGTVKTALKHRDGKSIAVECNLAILNLDERETILVMAHDISETVRHEKEVSQFLERIEEDNVQLRKLSSMKDNFLSMVSHELRTPLTSIMGYIKLVMGPQSAMLDEETRRDFLKTALSNADRLLSLVNDLLDLSRLEDGRLVMHKEEVSVHSVVENALKTVQYQMSQKKIVLNSPVFEQEWKAFWDGAEIERVLINLLANAVKFSPREGALGVEVVRENREGRIGYSFSVTDQGPGIPPEDITRVFEKFYQVDNAMTRKAGGTGLGLTIAKGIVESHDGVIWAESGPKVGTSMRFFLPDK